VWGGGAVCMGGVAVCVWGGLLCVVMAAPIGFPSCGVLGRPGDPNPGRRFAEMPTNNWVESRWAARGASLSSALVVHFLYVL